MKVIKLASGLKRHHKEDYYRVEMFFDSINSEANWQPIAISSSSQPWRDQSYLSLLIVVQYHKTKLPAALRKAPAMATTLAHDFCDLTRVLLQRHSRWAFKSTREKHQRVLNAAARVGSDTRNYDSAISCTTSCAGSTAGAVV